MSTRSLTVAVPLGAMAAHSGRAAPATSFSVHGAFEAVLDRLPQKPVLTTNSVCEGETETPAHLMLRAGADQFTPDCGTAVGQNVMESVRTLSHS